MATVEEIINLIEKGEIEEFIFQSSEIDNSAWGKVENLTALIDAIKIPNLGLRDYIYRIIPNIPDSSKNTAAELLSHYILYTDKEIRNLASDLLTKLGEVSNTFLLKLITEEDVDVKKFASDIFGYTGTDREIPNLINLLKDADMNVFTSAIEAIGSIFDRHKEKEGLADSVMELFVKIYDSENIETKPVIIEAISKIGGVRASMFLVNLLNTEDDIFIFTMIIDALAICGDSEELCQRIYDEIESYHKELQPIALKTLVAVALRVGYEIQDNSIIRGIANIALVDTDPDIRTAGLIALGYKYHRDEIPQIVKEYLNQSDDLKYYILSNVLTIENINQFEYFFKLYLESDPAPNHTFIVIELLNYIQNLIDDIDRDVILQVFKIVIRFDRKNIDDEIYDIFDFLKQINIDYLTDSLNALISENEENSDYIKLLNHFKNNKVN